VIRVLTMKLLVVRPRRVRMDGRRDELGVCLRRSVFAAISTIRVRPRRADVERTECLSRRGFEGMAARRCTSHEAQGAHLADVRGLERLLLGCGGGQSTLPELADVLSIFDVTPADVSTDGDLVRPLVQSSVRKGTP
jgi:hypothetical protein